MPTEADKLFYTIGEVAEIFGENTSLIRFWANRFSDIINPQKNKKGNRLFSKNDVENFKLIHFLVREQGMKLDGAHKKIIENRDGTVNNLQAIRTLENIKSMLDEIKNSI